MRVKKPSVHKPRGMTAKTGSQSGAVHLTAPVTPGGKAHEWQYSTDQKTWMTAPATLAGRTTITGLQPGALMYFRHRAVTTKGPGEWSQIISVIVQ